MNDQNLDIFKRINKIKLENEGLKLQISNLLQTIKKLNSQIQVRDQTIEKLNIVFSNNQNLKKQVKILEKQLQCERYSRKIQLSQAKANFQARLQKLMKQSQLKNSNNQIQKTRIQNEMNQLFMNKINLICNQIKKGQTISKMKIYDLQGKLIVSTNQKKLEIKKFQKLKKDYESLQLKNQQIIKQSNQKIQSLTKQWENTIKQNNQEILEYINKMQRNLQAEEASRSSLIY